MIASPPLFRNSKEFIVVIFILLSLVFARLFLIYQDYTKFINSKNYYTKAQIIKVYSGKKREKLLKLHSDDGFYFYLKTDKKNLFRYEWVLVTLKVKKNLSFFNYLKGFFTSGEITKVLDKGFDQKYILKQKIDLQHQDSKIKDFYNAIYLAEPLNKELRDKISLLGISHLVALSGFHLGILWAVIFGILYYPYRFFQKRFFPWRHRGIDLGFFTLFVLYLYIVFTGFPPALVRAYVMLLIGWIALRASFSIVSFRLLAVVLLLILIVEPRLIASYGLLFSAAGVFYIFLILKWFKELPLWFISFIIIPFGVFILMFPLGHYFFPAASIWQLSSPILSLLFIPFYPISVLAHFLGYGYVFDKALLWLFNLPKNGTNIFIPNGLIILYLLLSFASIFNKKIFYTTLALSLTITLYTLSISL